MSENIFLKIVKTWQLKELPEFRGFRCANCQKYMNKAWYHWLDEGGYKTPVHFCDKCEKEYGCSQIKILNLPVRFNRKKFGFAFPPQIKSKIINIAGKWDTKAKPVYKMFTCDECQRSMIKAYHVWANLNNTLIETHFCWECGQKLGFHKIITGIIYDLDGTLISTTKLHESAWLAAARKFNVSLTKEMLLNQKGVSNKEAACMMLSQNKRNLLHNFVKSKQNYVMKNIKEATIFPGTIETINQLKNKGYRIWICTSAKNDFAQIVLKHNNFLKNAIGDNIIWREMYKKEKPAPDALNLTMKKMGLDKSQVCYVGDAFNDYKTSKNTGVKFIFFFQDRKDSRIPVAITAINSHKKIFQAIR